MAVFKISLVNRRGDGGLCDADQGVERFQEMGLKMNGHGAISSWGTQRHHSGPMGRNDEFKVSEMEARRAHGHLAR